jgi:hypothetical protein
MVLEWILGRLAGERYGVNLVGLGYGPVARSRENGNEPFGSGTMDLVS